MFLYWADGKDTSGKITKAQIKAYEKSVLNKKKNAFKIIKKDKLKLKHEVSEWVEAITITAQLTWAKNMTSS